MKGKSKKKYNSENEIQKVNMYVLVIKMKKKYNFLNWMVNWKWTLSKTQSMYLAIKSSHEERPIAHF